MKAKKLFILTVVTVLFTGFCSCSDNDNDGTFTINKSEVFQMKGNKDNISILPVEGTYTVKSLDESIATGEIKKTDKGDGSPVLLSVVVTPVSKGQTSFIISNGIEEKTVDVTVVDPYIVFQVSKQAFMIMADQEKKEAIAEEMNKNPFLNMGNVLMLVKDEGRTLYLYEKKDDVRTNERSKSDVTYKSKGSYDLVKSEGKTYLTLKIGDRSSRFEVDGDAAGKSIFNSFFDLNRLKSALASPDFLARVTFSEDLTEEYNVKFQGGVSSVLCDYSSVMLNQRQFWLPFEE